MRKPPISRTVQLMAVVFVLTAGATVIPAAAQNPITAAREALRKAQEELKRKQEEERRRKEQQAQKPPQPQSAPATASPPSNAQGGSTQPVSLSDLEKEEAPTPLEIGEWKGMPDIVGVHLNMPLDQAAAALKQQYPQAQFRPWMTNPLGNTPAAAFSKPITTALSMNREAPGEQLDRVDLHLTQHPNAQLVWRLDRTPPRQDLNRSTLIAALRQKYGKETYAPRYGYNGEPATRDSEFTDMYWVFDEQGRLTKPVIGDRSIPTCYEVNTLGNVLEASFVQQVEKSLPQGCASFIGVHAYVGSTEVHSQFRIRMVNVPLGLRAAKVTTAWKHAMLEKARQEEIERSKQAKPKL